MIVVNVFFTVNFSDFVADSHIITSNPAVLSLFFVASINTIKSMMLML